MLSPFNTSQGKYDIILDYREIIVGGLRLDKWIPDDVLNILCRNRVYRPTKSVLLWNLIHICLSFYHINGTCLCTKRFTVLQNLIESYMPNLCRFLTHQNLYMLYCFTVGTYGFLDKDLTYTDYIQVCLDLEESKATYRLRLDPQHVSRPFHPLPYPRM